MIKEWKKNSFLKILTAWAFMGPLSLSAETVSSVESPDFKRSELTELQKTLGIEIGGSLDLNRLNSGIHELYNTANRRLIFVELKKVGPGWAVVLRGSRFRVLKGLEFVGITEEVRDEVVKGSDLQIGRTIDLSKISVLREKIKAEYQNQGYPATSVDVEIREEDKSEGVYVAVRIAQNAPTRVTKVSFSGVGRAESAELIDRIPLKKGSVYSKRLLDASSEALRQYFKRNRRATSRVETTSIKMSDDKLSVEVTFVLKLGEKYQFEFTGNTAFEEFELRNLLTEESLSQSDATNRIAEQIEAKYRRVGFHFVKVDAKSEIRKEEQVHVIHFDIHEGNRVIIDRVHFNGANLLSENRMEGLFFEGAPGVLGRGVYWDEGIAEATAKLRGNVERNGFLSASFTGPRLVFSEDKKGVELIYDVDLGNQTRFRGFEIHGNKKLSESVLISKLQVGIGEEVNWEKVAECKRSVISAYLAEGYVDVTVEEKGEKTGLILSPDQRDAHLVLTVHEGQQYFVGDISIEGNKRTKKQVILREMSLASGDKFDPAKLKDSEDNLALLQLFSRVELVTFPNQKEPLKRDIKIVVVEIKPGSGEIGLGAAYEDPRFRARSFLGLQYRNLWGLNHSVSQRTELTIPLSHQQSLIPFIEYAVLLGYRAPYPFEIPFTFAAQAGLDSYEIAPLSGAPVLQTRARIEERIEKKLGKRVTGIYRLHRYERTTVENLTEPPAKVTNSIGSTGPGLIVDLRDDSFNPTKGSYHTLDVEVAHPSLLSEDSIGFMMAIARNSFYFPLTGNVGMILFAGAGYARSFFPAPIPVARLANDLSLGGQSSLRGYSSKEYQPDVNYVNPDLNPRETAFINGRIEIVTPLVENVSGAVFFDSGQLYPNLIPAGRKDGLGLGFRYKTPVGPVVIDIAHGFESREKNVKFTFTIGSI